MTNQVFSEALLEGMERRGPVGIVHDVVEVCDFSLDGKDSTAVTFLRCTNGKMVVTGTRIVSSAEAAELCAE